MYCISMLPEVVTHKGDLLPTEFRYLWTYFRGD